MICEKCNNEIATSDALCLNCGNRNRAYDYQSAGPSKKIEVNEISKTGKVLAATSTAAVILIILFFAFPVILGLGVYLFVFH
ncbi:MAG: hypothetical protein EB103_03360 [Actinobacteria bacterium]|nr:hypothetical protein [Actinomycetota bacterium]